MVGAPCASGRALESGQGWPLSLAAANSVLAPIAIVCGVEEDGHMTRLRALAVLVAALVVMLSFAGVVLVIVTARADTTVPGSNWLVLAFAPAVFVPAGVGFLLVWKRPRNVIGWALLLGALSIDIPTEPYAAVALIAHPGSLPAGAWVGELDQASWPLLYAWPLALAYLFPTGQLPSRRWRPAAWVAGVSVPLVIVSIALTDTHLAAPFAAYRNPFPVLPSAFIAVRLAAWLAMFGALFAGAACIWRRFRRSSGVERLQIKWLAWSALLIPFALAVCLLSQFVAGGSTVYVLLLLLLAQTVTAISVGIALTRYRLYEIDRLINKTLVYGVVTVLLGGAYVGLVSAVGVGAGRGSTWVTALATLAVAVAFRPLRARVQNMVDRKFDRIRYESVRRVRAFEDDVRRGRAAPEQVGAVLREALHDTSARLLYWLPASETYVDEQGRPAAPPGEGRTTEVRRRGARLGLLAHPRRSPSSRDCSRTCSRRPRCRSRSPDSASR